jgi:hypothetical protein
MMLGFCKDILGSRLDPVFAQELETRDGHCKLAQAVRVGAVGYQ